MALAHALAPEGVGVAARKNGFRKDSVDGEQTGIPAAGNDGGRSGCLRSRIDVREVFRDPCMGIEAVDHIEDGCNFGRLVRKIRSAAAAEDDHIHFILPCCHVAHGYDGHAAFRLHGFRISSRKDTDKLHVIRSGNRRLCAFAQISVTCNCCSDHCNNPPLIIFHRVPQEVLRTAPSS